MNPCTLCGGVGNFCSQCDLYNGEYVKRSVIEDIRQIVDNWDDDENAMRLADEIKEVLSCTKVQ